MHYVYVMRSKKDGRLHIGHTCSLNRSLGLRNGCSVTATKDQSPLTMVYFEACCDKRDALKRERYLRGVYGRRFLENRLRFYLSML